MSAKTSPVPSRRSSGPLPTLETGGDSPQPRLVRRQSLPADSNGSSIERLPDRILGMRTSLPREVLEEPEMEGTPEGGVAGGPKPVAGVLEKWVNYGKGWRQRWFVLERGLLSYYKLSGPDKVSIAEERLRHAALHILGKEAHKDVHEARKSGPGGGGTSPRPLGSVHMMLASIRESAADEKKFYVHTGTKTLHLRAQTREDRALWVRQLREAKAQFKDQRGLLPPAGTPLQDSLAETLAKLRVVLLGSVEQAKMDAVEELVKEEAGVWQGRLQAEREKRRLLLEYVRTLEADKVELETAVLDQEEERVQGARAAHGGEDADSEDDDDGAAKDDAGNDTDPDDLDDTSHDKFFDAADDFVATDKVRKSLSRKNLPQMLEEPSAPGGPGRASPGGGASEKVVRRTQLPVPVQEEKSASLWSIIKDNVGKDLQKVCLPVYFNEPISALQKCCEDLEYTELLDRAAEAGRAGDPLGRVLNVAAFAVSGYAATEGRTRKPFNPLLGETYEAERPEQGIRFISEKVSHHPTIVACHCTGRGWRFYGDSNVKSKFWGRSIQVDPVGILTLEFDDGEVFQWSKVTTSIYNLIIGKLYCDHYGTMRIQGNRELSAKLKFKEQSILDRNPHQVRGVVTDRAGAKLATIFGKWDDALYFVEGDPHEKKLETLSTSQLLWQRAPPPEPADRYGLSRFAITLNEITPGLEEFLPPTDGRLRPDQRALENGEYDVANSEKLRLEQKQRAARKMQEHGWKPRWFTQDERSGTFMYQGGYWESREKGDWQGCRDIYGL